MNHASPPQTVSQRNDVSTAALRASSEFEVRAAADACDEVDVLLEELVKLSRADLSVEQFHEQLLHAALRQSGALAGAIWAGSERVIELVVHESQNPLVVDQSYERARREYIDGIVAAGKPAIRTVRQGTATGGLCGLIGVVAPYFVEATPAGGIELLLPDDTAPASRDRALHLAEAWAELIGDYHRRRHIALCGRREVHWRAVERFCREIHRPGLRETAVSLANEGRLLIGCDRVSVFGGSANNLRLLAVSAVDRIERRSNLVGQMEALAGAVSQSNEEVWETGQPAQRSPQIEQTLQHYLEASHSRVLVALPLTYRTSDVDTDLDAPAMGNNECCAAGVLVLEWFRAEEIDDRLRERIDLAARHGAQALHVALATERLPFISVNRAIARFGWLGRARQRPVALWCAGIFAALLLALVVVPADFQVSAEGELQPAVRRELFAPIAAQVDSVFVEHGDDIDAGQPLLRLRSASLDLESARVRGEIQTAEKRLSAIRLARLDRKSDKDAAPYRGLQLTAEEEELKQSLASLRRQEQLLDQQRAQLEVQSPIPGRVLTWDVAGSLAARPVERGQSLLSVGNVAGPWTLELRVADEHIGYVLSAAEQARQESGSLPVTFLLVGEPGITYYGEITTIARRSQMDETLGKSVVLVTVRLDTKPEHSRPGAAAVGKIDCGRRSLGFVWFHDAWNNLRRRLLF